MVAKRWVPQDGPDEASALEAAFATSRQKGDGLSLRNTLNWLVGLTLPWVLLGFVVGVFPVSSAVYGPDALGWTYIAGIWTVLLLSMLALEAFFATPNVQLWRDGRLLVANPLKTYRTTVSSLSGEIEKNWLDYPVVRLKSGLSRSDLTVVALQESEFQEAWLGGSDDLAVLAAAMRSDMARNGVGGEGFVIVRTRRSLRFWLLFAAWLLGIFATLPW